MTLPVISEQHNKVSPYIVVFAPDWSQSNPYQKLLKASLEKHQVKVEFRNFPTGLFSLNRLRKENPKTTVLHIHWINELIKHVFWSRNHIFEYVKLAFLALDILYVRYQGIKIIWTIHNLVSHESPDQYLEIMARRIIAKTCNHIIIHSTSALLMIQDFYSINIKEKASVIPHGNYDGCYMLCSKRVSYFKNTYQLEDDSIIMLFFGAIRPYKGVEKLIDIFTAIPNPKLRLIVAGNPQDVDFAESIASAAVRDPRIHLLLQFIPDTDVAALFHICDIVVLPFERTLTSGSVVLALSMGKALLLPNDARVLDI
ncbi:MAG: glycosyltransferase, partial [Streptococcus sp.]|nr:glycosyltransferase [Streptococcus sp.]